MNILRKRAQKVKKITILHFMSTFHNVALKIETEWVFKPIMKTRYVNDKY